jgi:hypothetical protein
MCSKAFKTSPFFLIQSNGSDKRFIASFQEKKIEQFLISFIDNTSDELQIKIRDFDNLKTQWTLAGKQQSHS